MSLKPGELDERGLARLFGVPWVPSAGERAAWTFADCDCEPCITHCVRCDGRRLMLSMVRQYHERAADLPVPALPEETPQP